MEQIKYPDYRELLQNEFAQRLNNNSKYSLRQFAKELNMRPSQLSEVLHKKHGISQFKSKEIVSRFNWSMDEKTFFCELVAMESTKNELRKKLAKERVERILEKKKFLQIENDIFSLVSQGYHYTIIALTQLKDFRYDLDWISGRLEISVDLVQEAIGRMKRLNLLKEEGSTLVPTYEVSFAGKEIPSLAIQRAHSEWLRYVDQNFKKIEVQNREISNSVLSLTREEFLFIKSQIQNLRDQICSQVKTSPKDNVYIWGHYLIPVLEGDKK